MIGNSIVTPIQALWSHFQVSVIEKRTDLHTFWQHRDDLPDFVRESPTAMRYLDLLGPLFWTQLPERNLVRNWGQSTISNAAFLAACLIKLEEGRDSMGDLLLYLQEHPALIWLLGFPRSHSSQHPYGFDPQASLPTERHTCCVICPTSLFNIYSTAAYSYFFKNLLIREYRWNHVSHWIQNTSLLGLRRTTRKPMLRIVLRRPNNPKEIQTANWVANESITGDLRKLKHLPHPPLTRFQQIRLK
jgi:hypothetical protein